MLRTLVKPKTKIDFRTRFKEGLQPLDTGHNIHTPFSLCDNILKNIKPNSNQKFGILYTLGFAITLIEDFGIDPKNIWLFGDSPEKKKIANHLGINYNSINVLQEINMKFDIVLTNPPYQDENKKSIVMFHIKNALDKVKPGGYLGVVSSRGWVNGEATQKGFSSTSDFCKLRNWQIEVIDPDTNKHFNDIGKSTNYFILHKISKHKPTKILSNKNFSVDLSKYNFLPYWLDESIYSIFDKVMIKNNFWFDFHDIDNDKLTSPAVCYPRAQFISFDSVMISDGTKVPPSKTIHISEIKTQDMPHCEFLFRSKFFRFLHFIYGGQDGVSPGYLRKLPRVPTSIINDEDLYKYFNLNQNEITYIENRINY